MKKKLTQQDCLSHKQCCQKVEDEDLCPQSMQQHPFLQTLEVSRGVSTYCHRQRAAYCALNSQVFFRFLVSPLRPK